MTGDAMPSDAFTIRVFVADGDPEGIRLIDRMNWTGIRHCCPAREMACRSPLS
jgi:hypothetical protein